MASIQYSPRLVRQLLQLPPSIRRSCFSTAATPSKPEIYDLVCVGGGPAGLSLLSSLRSNTSTRDLKVAIIDSQDLTTSRAANDASAYSNRCSSLTPASLDFLSNIGAWRHVDARRVQGYHGMEVWDGVSGAKISFDPLEAKGGLLETIAELVPGSRFHESVRKRGVAEDPAVMATMCENQNLTAGLLQRIKEVGGVEMLDKTKVESIEFGPEPEGESGLDLSQWPIITLPNSRQLAARLLVGADGANSPVRNFADIKSDGWDYNQHGIVATLHLNHSFAENNLRTAYQRFLPTGPIALLPLPGNKASLVWSMSTPLATKLKSLPPSHFATMVSAAFKLQQVDLSYLLTHAGSNLDIADELSWRLPNTSTAATGLPPSFPNIAAVQEGSIASFPLRMRHAATYTRDRVALIGDAAHTIHPLAGQGLNLGLADADSLAKQIVYGVEHGMDIGSNWCLDGYNADRWAANNAVMGVCDKLNKLYRTDSAPVVFARSLGLNLVNSLGPLKGALMGAAGGK